MQSFEQIFRTHKLDLERKVGKGVDVHLPVMAWLAEHVADMYNKSHVYEDGKTAYEKLRGRKYKGEMLPFGCQVLHRGRWIQTYTELTGLDDAQKKTEANRIRRAVEARRGPGRETTAAQEQARNVWFMERRRSAQEARVDEGREQEKSCEEDDDERVRVVPDMEAGGSYLQTTNLRAEVEKVVMDGLEKSKQEEEMMVSSEGESTGVRRTRQRKGQRKRTRV